MKALRSAPRHAPAQLGLAQTVCLSGKVELAREALEPLLRSGLGEALRLLAQAYQAAGRLDVAERVLKRWAQAEPKNPLARVKLGEVLRLRGREGGVRLSLADAASLPPAERFRALMKAGRYAEAFACAEQIARGGVGRAEAAAFWDPWGFSQDKAAQAQARVWRALATLPPSPWLCYYRASPEDLDALDALLSKRRYAWMLLGVGVRRLMMGRFVQAAASLEAFIRRCGWEWKAHGYLAETYLCLGRRADAVREVSRGVKEAPAPEEGQALGWRGELKLWVGDYAGALKDLERACRLGAQHAFCYRAAAHLKLGRPKIALAEIEETLARFPQDLEAAVWRAEALRALGRPREALKGLGRPGFWATVNRALARRELGETARMKREFARLPRDAVSRLRAKAESDDAGRILDTAILLSRGYRRDDYAQRVWLA